MIEVIYKCSNNISRIIEERSNPCARDKNRELCSIYPLGRITAVCWREDAFDVEQNYYTERMEWRFLYFK